MLLLPRLIEDYLPHRMPWRHLIDTRHVRIHDCDMVDLEVFKSSGSDMVELGDNHEIYPPNSQRHTTRQIVVDMNVNINLVPIEKVTDLPCRLPMSVFHLLQL